MNFTQLLKTGIVLILLVVFSVKVAAQETINTITFTWNTDAATLLLDATANKEYTIDWGDGTIETKTGGNADLRLHHIYTIQNEYTVTIAGSTPDCRFTYFNFNLVLLEYETSNLILTGCSDLETLYCYDGRLDKLDLSGCPKLTHLGCAGNQLVELDLSGCPKLKHLLCEYNQISSLDLSRCSELMSLNCSNNQIPLSDLYAAQLLISDPSENLLGTQTLQPQTVKVGEELFTDQSVFGGIFTQYSVIKNENPAPESDYTVTDGKLIFKAVGEYTVTMTNDAIVSNTVNPARVVVEIRVEKGTGIANTTQNDITIYPNPATTEIYVKYDSQEPINYAIYSTTGQQVLRGRLGGETIINIQSLSKGIYYLKLDGKENKTVSFIKN